MISNEDYKSTKSYINILNRERERLKDNNDPVCLSSTFMQVVGKKNKSERGISYEREIEKD